MEKGERMFGDVNIYKNLYNSKYFDDLQMPSEQMLFFSWILLIKILRDKVRMILSQLSVIMFILKR